MSVEHPIPSPASIVLRNVANELEDLRRVSLALEGAMTDVLSRDDISKIGAAERTILQDFDLLGQSLEGLTTFLEALAPAFEDNTSDYLRAALHSLKLGAMRERLSGDRPDVAPEASDGEIDLF